MFLGARVGYTSGSQILAGVVIKLENNVATVKFDDETTIQRFAIDKLQLINTWKTWKKPRDIGAFRIFPNTIEPLSIFTSKKPILFGVAGMRSCWYWGNDVIFDNKLREPKFIPTVSRSKAGSYTTVKREMRISSINHSVLEFTNTLIHEQIHQMNMEVEHSPYDVEGYHGASFRKWIPIIRQRTGLIIKVTANTSDDVTDFSDTDTKPADEPTVKEFIFLLFKLNSWFCVKVDERSNLPLLKGQIYSLMSKNHNDTDLIYAGKSNLARVQRELLNSKDGNLPRLLKFPFSPSLVNLLAKTAKPISGYRNVEEIELKG